MGEPRLIDFQPRVLPAGWSFLGRERLTTDADAVVARYFRALPSPLQVLVGVEVYERSPWLHISTSAPSRIPTWEELRDVKDLFMRERLAVQVLPPPEHYLNHNPYVLHLWSRLDDYAIPFELWRLH